MLVQRMDITAENAELGEMPERKAEAIRTPRFFDLGVKLAYDFKLYKTVDLQLNGGVQNIFESYLLIGHKNSFPARYFLFPALKHFVSNGETICFTPGNTLFQALKLKVSSG